jgi:hypothetical protein
MKAAYGNLSTFVGYFHRDPRIVFFFDPAGEGEDNEDSKAINSSEGCLWASGLCRARTYLGKPTCTLRARKPNEIGQSYSVTPQLYPTISYSNFRDLQRNIVLRTG